MLPSELPRNPHDERAAALALLREDATAPEGRNRLAAQASAASPCSSSAACPAEETEAIDRWCEQFLIGMPRLTMRTFELTGRGLAAGPAGLAAGDAALRIPLRLVLTSKALPRHPLLDTLHEDLRLAIALLYEPVRDPDGPWAKYTPLLPSSPPSALGWTPAQLARMGATPLPQQVAELRLTLEAAYAKAFPALSEALPELLPPSHFTWPRFLWAYSMVETRGLVLSLQVPRDHDDGGDGEAAGGDGDGGPRTRTRGGCAADGGAGHSAASASASASAAPAAAARGAKETVLVPFADMMNHHPSAALAWPRVEVGGGRDAGGYAGGNAGGTQAAM